MAISGAIRGCYRQERTNRRMVSFIVVSISIIDAKRIAFQLRGKGKNGGKGKSGWVAEEKMPFYQ